MWTLCKVLVYLITSPILFVLSVLGGFFWIILLPLSCFLGPLSCIVDIAFYFAKAPFRMFQYLFTD